MYEFKTVIHRSGVTGEILTEEQVLERLSQRRVTLTLLENGGVEIGIRKTNRNVDNSLSSGVRDNQLNRVS